jgi:hypothetical protein
MSDYVSCGNWYLTRRHLAVDLLPWSGGGRYGKSVCSSTGNPVEVFDQEAHDAMDRRNRGTPRDKRITDLPECKKCAKAAS